ncbi:MAG: NADH:flavin oxidoreductase [Deltaproteobacteria bacterium]|jgi:2,4-dienoyl-CoA reductase-like NADH-dependent reductase (Old Yellow Enzyme family)|nr:NADH:flavin oxidoreductase [Deltaproteobacteria bacterium]MBT4087085.1 NADH:flavin oxidoreductase [Deltaproteobacteria bacterium]MBT4262678.1 NADH:flavin oxidoreductase [Deltaproteobacteria bacterium]MBT4643223.1 NADH:flavin oxidoreductase [Deltaproteobacteria bacterium]MBT6503762.1 NADH:flavin oxidoreductase [Deltaproteobacteria bacterium]
MSKLFEPLEIGKLKIANRFVRSATYYALSDQDGFISDGSVELMKTLAGGDIGLIITGYAFVIKHGQVFPDMNGIDQDDHIAAYQKMTGAVHAQNGKIVMQIAHGGSISTHAAQGNGDYVAVSLTDATPDYGRKPRVLTDDDIQTIIEAFGQAARRVQESGFDGVQIHGAHGYLVSEFLSPTTNQRQDKWGGSLENRTRFLVEVIRSIKRNVADDFPVLIKFGCQDYLEDGSGFTIEEGKQVAQTIEKEGVSLIEISHGRIEKTFRKRGLKITAPENEAYMLEAAKAIRSAVSIPLCLVGGMRSIPVIENILNEGIVDMVSLCRPFIREPELVKRLKKGEKAEVDCISCWGCINPDKEGKNHVFCRQLHKKKTE